MTFNAIIDQIFSVTPTEGALGIFAAALIIQFVIFRVGINSALSKNRHARFPGLLEALADIPARADVNAKHRNK